MSARSYRYVPSPREDHADWSWHEPLALFERAMRSLPQNPDDELFACADFLIMGRLVAADRPDLLVYKHFELRTYVNVDTEGQPYEFVAPKSLRDAYGSYRPHTSLRRAVADLGLADLVWMRGKRSAASPPRYRPIGVPGPPRRPLAS